jgi:hypothetical protein
VSCLNAWMVRALINRYEWGRGLVLRVESCLWSFSNTWCLVAWLRAREWTTGMTSWCWIQVHPNLSMARLGNAAEIIWATLMFASNMNSSTSWFDSFWMYWEVETWAEVNKLSYSDTCVVALELKRDD